VPEAVEGVLVLNAMPVVSSPAESTALLERGLRLGRQVGEASPVYAEALFDHGFHNWDSGRAEEALPEIHRALAIMDAVQPRPIEDCEGRHMFGQRLMVHGDLAAARKLMADSMSCLERALLPGSAHLMWARLGELELLVRERRFEQAIGPLDAFIDEIPRRRPRDREMLSYARELRRKALCQGCAK
jgi:hypothetical protein